LDQAFVEVPSKEEVTSSISLKASLNHGFPSDSKRLPFGATVLSQRTPIHAG
jgi:hypothetical protein